MSALSGKARKHLRGLAHGLRPVVRVGRGGATPGVQREIEAALESHELIKVHLAGDRAERQATAGALAAAAGAEVVATIGGVAILYRRHPDPEKRGIELDSA